MAEARSKKLNELYISGSQHYRPLQWDKYGSMASTRQDLVNHQASPIPTLYLLYLNYTVDQEQEQCRYM